MVTGTLPQVWDASLPNSIGDHYATMTPLAMVGVVAHRAVAVRRMAQTYRSGGLSKLTVDPAAFIAAGGFLSAACQLVARRRGVSPSTLRPVVTRRPQADAIKLARLFVTAAVGLELLVPTDELHLTWSDVAPAGATLPVYATPQRAPTDLLFFIDPKEVGLGAGSTLAGEFGSVMDTH